MPNPVQNHSLFNYTSGRWIVNDALRHEERRREFGLEGLCRLAAQSVGRESQDVDTFVKLAEGGFNRTFLITMHDGFRMVARIPYPMTVPRSYAIASEVATMRFLRASGLPIPEVYDYSPSSDNAAETEYISMEFIAAANLTDVFTELNERDMISILRQVTQLESRMMSIVFPAGGSLYYADDLKRLGGKVGTLLEDRRFCVGPDVRVNMWSGRRSQLEVNRGPYETPAAALAAAARKEIAYLEEFGRPVKPLHRQRSELYEYGEQSPSEHIENLRRYLVIAPRLVPRNPSLCDFRIRHPDIQPSNIMVSQSSDPEKRWEVVSLLDWQHASVLPLFLIADIPDRLQNYDDPISQALVMPSLPENVDDLEGSELENALEDYSNRIIHFHYARNTAKYNKIHHDALWDPSSMLIRRLFYHAGAPWDGEAHSLKASLIESTERWEKLVEDMPCPIHFELEDVCATKVLEEKLQSFDEAYEGTKAIVGFGPGTWVPNEHYQMALKLAELLKLKVLAQIPKGKERDMAEANWFLDNGDESAYM